MWENLVLKIPRLAQNFPNFWLSIRVYLAIAAVNDRAKVSLSELNHKEHIPCHNNVIVGRRVIYALIRSFEGR